MASRRCNVITPCQRSSARKSEGCCVGCCGHFQSTHLTKFHDMLARSSRHFLLLSSGKFSSNGTLSHRHHNNTPHLTMALLGYLFVALLAFISLTTAAPTTLETSATFQDDDPRGPPTVKGINRTKDDNGEFSCMLSRSSGYLHGECF